VETKHADSRDSAQHGAKSTLNLIYFRISKVYRYKLDENVSIDGS